MLKVEVSEEACINMLSEELSELEDHLIHHSLHSSSNHNKKVNNKVCQKESAITNADLISNEESKQQAGWLSKQLDHCLEKLHNNLLPYPEVNLFAVQVDDDN